MRTILLSILTLVIFVTSNAQNNNSVKVLKLANSESAQLRYAYAIPLYKGYLKSNSKDPIALAKLADAYKINNQYDSAIKYYGLAKAAGANVGQSLTEMFANKGLYEQAIKASVYNDARIKGFQNPSQFKNDSLDYTVHYLSINTPFNEYAVVPVGKGIVFESNRAALIKSKNEFAWDGASFSKLYTSTNVNSTDAIAKVKWSEKKPTISITDLTSTTSNDNATISKKYDFKNVAYNNNGIAYFDEVFNNKFNAGSICIAADNNTAYFTRNQAKSNGVYQLEIWSVTKAAGKWSSLTKLAFNTIDASYMHPALSKDGKRLYFISDKVGGQGGTDLYYVEKDAQGNWSSAVNAGSKVNTVENELYPTISEGQLYISSNGHAGLGGLDIYKVKMNSNQIDGVENIGYPVNSSMDDMSYSETDKKGYFVSNRYGTDDIFSFEYELAMITISGKVSVSDKQPNAPITIKLFAAKEGIAQGVALQTIIAAADGSYAFKVRPNKEYVIEASETRGNKVSMPISSSDYLKTKSGVYEKSVNELVINIAPPPPPVVVKKQTVGNIVDSLKALTSDFVILHHDFDKVTLEKSHNREYNKLLARIRKIKGAQIVVLSAADCKGTNEYNEKLSARRATFISKQVIAASKKNKVTSLHVGEEILAEPCDETATKEQQLENRYTYIFFIK